MVLAVAFLVPALLAPAPAGALPLRETHLANGMRILYGESHASGLVASAVFVGAGAARETEGMNGAAHFLEHLLFNGTATRTQEELYRDTDLLGAYSNATTRRDHVVYLMVVGGEDLDAALEIQADMLLNSVLPPDKFEKERGIIIEEIGKDRANPEHRAEEEMTRLLGGETPDALPILGTVESIQALSRDDVLAYYHRYYVPANMTMLVLGDIVPENLLAAIERHFGGTAGDMPLVAPQKAAPTGMFLEPRPYARVHLRIRLPAPAPADSAFAALLVLEDLLGGESGRLTGALGAAPELAVDEISAGVRVEAGRSWLEIQAAFDSTTSYTLVAGRLLGAVSALAAAPVPAEELAVVSTRRAVSEALAAEQIHYVAFTRSGLLLHAPLHIVSETDSVLAAVSPAHVMRCAQRLLEETEGAALGAIGPGLRHRRESRDPRTLAAPGAARAAAAHAGAATVAEKTMADLVVQMGPESPPRVTSTHPPQDLVLANGLRLVLSANPDSDVFALHLTAGGRSYCEPPGKSGLADLLHRLLLLGAGPWSRGDLGLLIDRAGLQIRVTDIPGIPYDDYQTTQEYSFVRMETADRFYRQALAILAAMVFEPVIRAESLEEARREAIALAERREQSAGEQSLMLLRRAFYPDSRGASAPLGTVSDLKAITLEDVQNFHRRYFAPDNLVVSIVTGLDPDVLLATARAALERPGAASGPCAHQEDMLPTATTEPAHAEVEIGLGQSWIRLGSVFTCDPADIPALDVASLVLSDRLAFELRERQGLAYAIGASFGHRGDRGWIVAGMGTRPENLARAQAGLGTGIHQFAAAEIRDEDVTPVVKSAIGRTRMRSVTRINQAMYLGLDALAGGDVAGGGEVSPLSQVTAAQVRQAAAAYFTTAPLITAVAR